MDNELYEVIKIYTTKSHKELSLLLLGKSKDQLIAILDSLITIYINDRNSSLLREYITVSLAGYAPADTKIGYNGFKQSTKIGGELIACEAKPQNLNTEDNKKRKNPRHLNGGGNFTDYTYKRLERDRKVNPNMVISGFIDGELVYVLEFPFNYKHFVQRLKNQLKKRFPNGDKSGEYLRGANFTFEHYKDCKELKIVFLKTEKLEENKKHFVKKFYEFLLTNINETNK